MHAFAGMGTVSNKSLQQSAWRFITACLDVFTQTSSDIFSTFLAGVTGRSSDSRVAKKRAHTKRKVAGLELNKQLQEDGSSSRWRRAEMEVEGSNQLWRDAMRGGGEQKEEEGSNQRSRAQEAIRTA